jgi:hypothetical protein
MSNYDYSAVVSFWVPVLIKESNKVQCYLVMNAIKFFLVPNSCRATERNDNCIKEYVIEDTHENY